MTDSALLGQIAVATGREAWSLTCVFDRPPSEQGTPSRARVAFVADEAPHNSMRPGAILRMYERATGQYATVDIVLDLDQAATELRKHCQLWEHAGIAVGNVTWRERESDEWPPPLILDRAKVKAPWSLGVKLSRPPEEGTIILYEGGWADIEYWSLDGDEVCSGHPEVLDSAGFIELLDQMDEWFGVRPDGR